MNTQPALRNTEDEVQRLFGAVSDALSDQMVERLSSSAGNALEVVDRLNNEDTRDAVLTLLDELTALHRAGGLVAAFEWIHMINAIRNALTDPMIERLTTFLEQTVNNLSTEGLSDLAQDATAALDAARTETEKMRRCRRVRGLTGAQESGWTMKVTMSRRIGYQCGYAKEVKNS